MVVRHWGKVQDGGRRLRSKTKTHEIPHDFVLITPSPGVGNCNSFLIGWPLAISTCSFSMTLPWKFYDLSSPPPPPLYLFFLGIVHFCDKCYYEMLFKVSPPPPHLKKDKFLKLSLISVFCESTF